MEKLNVLLLLLACSLVGHGQEFVVDGLHFRMLEDETCELVSAEKGVYCDSLVIPDTVCGLPVTSIGDKCFRDHDNLKRVILPNTCRSIGKYAFQKTGLSRVLIPGGVRRVGLAAFSQSRKLVSLTVAEGDYPLTFVCEKPSAWNDTEAPELSPFNYCPIQDVYLGRSIRCDYRYMSAGDRTWITGYREGDLNAIYTRAHSEVMHLTISKLVVAPAMDTLYWGPTSAYKCFLPSHEVVVIHNKIVTEPNSRRCFYADSDKYFTDKNLTYLVNEDSVTCELIDWSSFEPTSSLDVVLPSGVEYDGKCYALTRIGREAFFENKLVETIEIPSTVTVIDDQAFLACDSLRAVFTDGSVAHVGQMAFRGCRKLEIFEGFNSVEHLGERAFSYAKSFFPDALPVNLKSVGNYCFEGSGVRTIRITPDMTLDEFSFNDCETHQVIVDEGVKNIPCGFNSRMMHTLILPSTLDSCRFFANSALKHVYSRNTFPPAFSLRTPFSDYTYRYATLHVPEGCRDIYLRAMGWMYFLTVHAALDDISADALTVCVLPGEIDVVGADPGEVMSLYTIDGRIIYNGVTHRASGLAPGLYVVRIGALRRIVRVGQ